VQRSVPYQNVPWDTSSARSVIFTLRYRSEFVRENQDQAVRRCCLSLTEARGGIRPCTRIALPCPGTVREETINGSDRLVAFDVERVIAHFRAHEDTQLRTPSVQYLVRDGPLQQQGRRTRGSRCLTRKTNCGGCGDLTWGFRDLSLVWIGQVGINGSLERGAAARRGTKVQVDCRSLPLVVANLRHSSGRPAQSHPRRGSFSETQRECRGVQSGSPEFVCDRCRLLIRCSALAVPPPATQTTSYGRDCPTLFPKGRRPAHLERAPPTTSQPVDTPDGKWAKAWFGLRVRCLLWGFASPGNTRGRNRSGLGSAPIDRLFPERPPDTWRGANRAREDR